MRNFLGICLMIGITFASALADGNTKVVKDRDNFLIYKCEETVTSNQPKLVTEALAKEAYDKGVSQTKFRSSGFAGLTRVKSNIFYEDGQLNVVDIERKMNVMMFSILVLFTVLVLLIVLKETSMIKSTTFIVSLYFLFGLSIFLSLTAATNVYLIGKYPNIPDGVINATSTLGLLFAIFSGFILAKIFKKNRGGTTSDGRAKKLLKITYFCLIVLLILSLIYGSWNGALAVLIVGAIISLPLTLIQKLTKRKGRARTPSQQNTTP